MIHCNVCGRQLPGGPRGYYPEVAGWQKVKTCADALAAAKASFEEGKMPPALLASWDAIAARCAPLPAVDRGPFEVPNLDDMSVDPRDYEELSRVFQKLALYAAGKCFSMQARLRGDIDRAAVREKFMQEVYETLPAWARW